MINFGATDNSITYVINSNWLCPFNIRPENVSWITAAAITAANAITTCCCCWLLLLPPPLYIIYCCCCLLIVINVITVIILLLLLLLFVHSLLLYVHHQSYQTAMSSTTSVNNMILLFTTMLVNHICHMLQLWRIWSVKNKVLQSVTMWCYKYETYQLFTYRVISSPQASLQTDFTYDSFHNITCTPI